MIFLLCIEDQCKILTSCVQFEQYESTASQVPGETSEDNKILTSAAPGTAPPQPRAPSAQGQPLGLPARCSAWSFLWPCLRPCRLLAGAKRWSELPGTRRRHLLVPRWNGKAAPCQWGGGNDRRVPEPGTSRRDQASPTTCPAWFSFTPPLLSRRRSVATPTRSRPLGYTSLNYGFWQQARQPHGSFLAYTLLQSAPALRTRAAPLSALSRRGVASWLNLAERHFVFPTALSLSSLSGCFHTATLTAAELLQGQQSCRPSGWL